MRFLETALFLSVGMPLVAQLPRGKIVVPATVRAHRNLVYARAGGKPLLLDLYRPEKPHTPVPVIVWIHGGAFRAGSKDGNEAALAVELSGSGYAVASINYRLSQEAPFPAQIQDCKTAIRWLRAHATTYGLQPERVGAFGSSAGGYLAAMLGTSSGVAELEGSDLGHAEQSSSVQAVVHFYGPTDFLTMDATAPPGGMQHDPPDSPESQLVGGPIQQNKSKVARANPITYVNRNAPPFLILHGDRDLLVPVTQSELLFQALSKAGVDVTFHKIFQAGHGGPPFKTPVVRAMVQGFFDQHLKDGR